MKKLCITFFFILANSHFAQDPYSINYNESNGLPSNVVYDIYQDSEGYIWSASDQGLSQFDGKKWINYRSKNQYLISGSYISEDVYGRIWYENFDGNLFYVYKNKMYSLHQNQPLNFINYGLSDNYLFVIQKKGVDVYDLKNLRRLKTIFFSTSLISASCSNGKLFIIIFKDKILKINQQLKVEMLPYAFDSNDVITTVFFTNEKFIAKVLETNQIKFFEFSADLTSFKTYKFNNNGTLNGLKKIDNEFWLPTSKGILVTNHLFKSTTKTLFKEKNISNILKDRQGNYWISTTNEGIFLISDLKNVVYPIEDYSPSQFEKVRNKILLANTKGALYQLDEQLVFEKKQFEHPLKEEIYYFEYDSIFNDIYFSSLGFTYISKLQFKKPVYTEFATKKVKRIDAKYAFVGTSTQFGLMRFSEVGLSKWDGFYDDAKEKNSIIKKIQTNRVRSIAYLKASEKVFWSNSTGFYSFDASKKVQEITYHQKPFFAKNLYEYNHKVMILSSQETLFEINSSNNLVNLESKYNFEGNKIQKIMGFNHQLVALGNEFVFLINLKTDQVQKLNVPLFTREIKDILYFNKAFLFLTKKSIIKVNHYLNENKSEAFFKINEVQISNKSYEFHKKIELKNNQYTMKIDYAVLDFGTVRSNQLFYRINQKQWIKLDENNRQLQLVLNDGLCEIEFLLNNKLSKEKVSILVATPFWKKPLFVVFVIVILLLLSYLYYQFQIKKLKKKNTFLRERNKLLEDKVTLERNLKKSILTTVKSQMNPHFFYNALNTIQAYIFKNDKTTASNYLSKFSKLTRLILEMSEQETVLLNDEIQALKLYLDLEKMRFQEAFEYQLNYDESLLQSIEIPSMIIQPYVENAVKHGLLHKKNGVGKIEIQFKSYKKELLITIKDNGVGRKHSEEINKIRLDKSKSFATSANKKRLDILNEGKTDKIVVQFIDNYDKNNQPIGTTVKLIIPLNYDI